MPDLGDELKREAGQVAREVRTPPVAEVIRRGSRWRLWRTTRIGLAALLLAAAVTGVVLALRHTGPARPTVPVAPPAPTRTHTAPPSPTPAGSLQPSPSGSIQPSPTAS